MIQFTSKCIILRKNFLQ